MNPCQFPEANKIYTAPVDQPDVQPLHVHEAEDGCKTSCWEVSDEDLARITKDRKIWLKIYAKYHPPVLVTTEL